ncbi:hypothetical protein O6H91_Y010200 [Diphasiastrum complanatum]|nr:hypothetical protein O6H91_Y010200 [Diphasiastrum complanatum]
MVRRSCWWCAILHLVEASFPTDLWHADGSTPCTGPVHYTKEVGQGSSPYLTPSWYLGNLDAL